MKTQYIIVLTIIISLTASMLFLAYTEQAQRDKNQDFWSTYFIAPITNTDNRFVIDNKTPNDTTFHYEISINNELQETRDIEISKNTRKLIETKNFNNQNIQITVTNDKNKKTISKK